MKEVRFSALEPEWQRLIKLMQQLNYGRLEHLTVVNGIPKINMQLKIVTEYRFPGENGPCEEITLQDFALKREQVQFIDEVRAIKIGTIKIVYIKSGLPHRMEVKGLV
jgi:hypothetical protein